MPRFETLAVHAGHEADPTTGSVASPIYLSTTFARDPEGVPLGGHTYIRESNPNEHQLETALATALELANGASKPDFGERPVLRRDALPPRNARG